MVNITKDQALAPSLMPLNKQGTIYNRKNETLNKALEAIGTKACLSLNADVADKYMGTLYHIIMKQIFPWCFLASIISPLVFIVGYPVGIIARESKLAPRLGLTVIIQTTLLILTCMGVIIWFSIYPAVKDNVMNPYSVYMVSGGPQTILALISIVVTIGTMIRKNRKHSGQSGPGYPPQGVGSPER